MIRKLIYSLLVLLITCATQAQSTDEQLASHYYRNGEYDKAVMYYEKLYDKSPSSYYSYYLICLTEMGDYEEAEKLAKKQLKKEPYNIQIGVDLGEIYEAQGELKDAEEQYNSVIEDLPADRMQIINLANTFSNRGKNDYALATYEQGEKLMKGYSNFHFEIASIYGKMGEYELMIEQFLNLLEENSGYIQSVQNQLSRIMVFTEDSDETDLLRVGLLKRIQKNPDAVIFSEMLIWLYIQQRDFESAYVQAKALDKREKGGGERVRSLALLCISNEEYELAVDCYEYIIAEGESGYYYKTAKSEILDAMYLQVTVKHQYTDEELVELETRFTETLEELGEKSETVHLMKKLAHLQAFYLHKDEEPMFLLKNCIDMPGVSDLTRAECKIELADILLMNGAIWDASLYYAQVEKDFKHDIIGHEAKFKYARIFYFTGDFLWAQSQLDVLKASTSKLIANDAMQLSILITDNYALDTVATAMELYARADLLTFQYKFDEALTTLDTINMIYPWHTLNDEILFQKYKIEYGRGNYETSVTYLDAIIKDYSDDILADDAYFYKAKLYDNVLDDPELAMKLYSDLMLKYKGSLYTEEASDRFRFLRGDYDLEKGDIMEMNLTQNNAVSDGEHTIIDQDSGIVQVGTFENGKLKFGLILYFDENGDLISTDWIDYFESKGEPSLDMKFDYGLTGKERIEDFEAQ